MGAEPCRGLHAREASIELHCSALQLSCCRAVVLSCCRAVVLSCCRPELRAVIELNPLHLLRVDLGRPERRDVGLGRPLRSGIASIWILTPRIFLPQSMPRSTAGRRAAGATVDGHGAWFRGIAAGTPPGAAQPIEQPTPEAEPGQTGEQRRIVRWHLALAGAAVNPTPGCIYFDNGRSSLRTDSQIPWDRPPTGSPQR
jgi:hypothetical protein